MKSATQLAGRRPDRRDLVPFDGPQAEHAVEVAPRIWWVGAVLENDPFQCHAYLVEAGEHSVLVDPGSTLTIETTLRKVQEVVPLDHIATLLVHHSDPDCADGIHRLGEVLDHERVRILTEWRSQLLLRHMDPPFRFVTTEDLDWQLDLGDGRVLEFALTPYLHFPGAFVTFEGTTGTLMSSDLFGGFNRQSRLVATSISDFEDLRAFHQHYMPSREILMAGLARLRSRFPHITKVLPQHGYVIPEPLVGPMFDELFRLECGVLLMSREDAHLAKLIEAAGAVRRIEDHLTQGAPLPELLDQIAQELRVIIDVDDLAVEVSDGATTTRFDRTDTDGTRTERSEPGPGRLIWPLGDDDRGRRLTAVIEHSTTDHPLETEMISLLDAATEQGRREFIARLDLLEAGQEVERWQHDASHDALTGLLNRHALTEFALEPGTAVLLLDLDHFKQINDTWGHDTGDVVLRRVADTLQGVVRAPDVTVRFGGEELLVIAALPNTCDPDGQEESAAVLAERVRSAVEHLDLTDIDPALTVTVSIGGAISRQGDTTDTAVLRADRALYRAKQSGRNRVEIATTARDQG